MNYMPGLGMQRKRKSFSDWGHLRNALLRLLQKRNHTFLVWATGPLDLFVRSNRWQPSFQKLIQPFLHVSISRSGYTCGSVCLTPYEEQAQPRWEARVGSLSGRWRSQAHLLDLSLEVPQLEALLEPLMGLLRIELQLMLLLVEELQ